MVKYSPLTGLGSLGQARVNFIFDEMPNMSINKFQLHKLAAFTLPSGKIPTISLNRELCNSWELCPKCIYFREVCLCSKAIHKRKLSSTKSDSNSLDHIRKMIGM